MARVKRSLLLKKIRDGEGGYAHREHRSPKGRSPRFMRDAVLDYKRRKQELKIYGYYRKGRK